jgi:tetratricopeptide (TPR) repeat protein
MDLAVIEQKLSRRPHSPMFARLADAYLKEGKAEVARELLLSGLEKYPSYPAAHLVLARAYAADRLFADAIRHLRIAAAAIPEAGHLAALEAEWEIQSAPHEEPIAADDAIEEANIPTAHDVAVAQAAVIESVAEEVSPATDLEPAVIEAVAEEVVPAVEVATEPAPVVAAEEPVRPAVEQPVQPAPRTTRHQAPARKIEDGRIVSKTLAEIYAMQGEYGEAIITYTMLKQHRPEMTPECDLRISELEAALQAKLNQQKVALTK